MINQVFIFYLHSTMFLLIHEHSHKVNRSDKHLHSTMFLLILKDCIENDIPVYHLHSTMFLLILGEAIVLDALLSIYIPQCFY